jgi:hypothetical protein
MIRTSTPPTEMALRYRVGVVPARPDPPRDKVRMEIGVEFAERCYRVFDRGLSRNRLPAATTAYSAPGVAVHGLMTVMPAARKGPSSRVATLNRRDAAMAAIWASATAIE